MSDHIRREDTPGGGGRQHPAEDQTPEERAQAEKEANERAEREQKEREGKPPGAE